MKNPTLFCLEKVQKSLLINWVDKSVCIQNNFFESSEQSRKIKFNIINLKMWAASSNQVWCNPKLFLRKYHQLSLKKIKIIYWKTWTGLIKFKFVHSKMLAAKSDEIHYYTYIEKNKQSRLIKSIIIPKKILSTQLWWIEHYLFKNVISQVW